MLMVVFINMLIAIMADTFSQVQQLVDESRIQEQAGLIQDHIWLLDLKELFKPMKYILIATPSNVQDQMVNDSTNSSFTSRDNFKGV